MEKVLAIGTSKDATMRHFRKMSSNLSNFDFLDFDKLSQAEELKVEYIDGSLVITLDDQIFDFGSYISFYNRAWLSSYDDRAQQQRAEMVVTAVIAELHLVRGRVLNRPKSLWLNSTKLAQMRSLLEFGFKVPEFMVTTEGVIVEDKVERASSWVTKGCSGCRTIVEQLENSDLLRSADVRFSPPLFQRRIVGTEFRIHIIGPDTIASEIECDVVDYRYADRHEGSMSIREVDIPHELASMLKSYCRTNELTFAGADLIRDASTGNWWILEVNPMPGYDFFDRPLDGKISDLLLKYLCEPEESLLDDALTELQSGVSIWLDTNRRPRLQF